MNKLKKRLQIKFFKKTHFKDKNEIYETIYREFFAKDGISINEMINAIEHREKMGDTYIGNNMVLIHVECNGLTEAGCYFLNTKEAFKWRLYKSENLHHVSTFIILSIPFAEESRTELKIFLESIFNEKLINKIGGIENEKELFELLDRIIYEN